MDPTIGAAIIAGGCSIIVGLLTVFLRSSSSSSSQKLRRSLTQREVLEDYAFRLRRQVLAAGRKPHPWPAALAYMRREDPDEGEDEQDEP